MATRASTSTSSYDSLVQAENFELLDDDVLDVEVLTAASSNQPVVVSKWLQSLPMEGANTRSRMVQVLKQAAHCLHVDVIKQFKSPPLPKRLLRKVINATDSEGMTILHHAAQCCQLQEEGKYNQYAIMEALSCLCDQGGDPTIICGQERTPKVIAEEDNCHIAAALLEILELIHCKKSKRFPVPQYANIDVLHKTILHWAVNSERHQIVSHILIMHQRDQYESITSLLFDSDPNSVESFQEAPIFTAAKIGNPDLLRALLARSGIPLNVVLGQRQKHVIPRPDDSEWERYDTPLSLLLTMPKSYSLIELLVDVSKPLYDGHPTSIDLSSTGISCLPVEVFQLQNLSSINVHNNLLTELPFSEIPTKFWPRLLQELNISHNSLEQVPSGLFELACLKTLNLSHNPLKLLPDQWWSANSIVTLNVSHTHLKSLSINLEEKLKLLASSTSLPRSHSIVQGQFSAYGRDDIACRIKDVNASLLQSLNAGNCNIDKFPHLLALIFPNLETLNLSGNRLQSMCAINELPTSLSELDLSDNNLINSKDCKVFHYDSRFAAINSCMRHQDLDKLKTLKLANNFQLKTVFLSDEIVVPNCGNPHVFFSKLRRLNLANCGLQDAPDYLADLQHLTDLDISNNVDITIPRGICNLESLVNFIYDGIKDPVVNDLNMFTLTRDKQIYLRQERNVRYPSIKLLFVGNEMINLPLCLGKNSIQNKAISMIVASENTWCVSKSSGNDLTIKFNVWNFIDQNNDKPFVASQCFLSENALYVLCWQITGDKDHGISKLRSWLMKIHDRAKSAPIIIVGCHNSSINDKMRHSLANIVKDFCKKSLPFCLEIVAVRFVTVPKLEEDIIQLCKCFYEAACDHKMSLGSKFLSQKLVNIRISKNYFQFLGLISKKVFCIEKQKEDGPPILKWSDLVLMAGLGKEDKKHSLFKDEKELKVAIKYMIENGTIMHFDNLGLNDYYFIDPHWLYYVFCRVCTSSMLTCSSKIDSDDGKVSRAQIQQVFKQYGIPVNYCKLMFKLLCRFEIAIPLDAETLLLPSALKSDPRSKLYSSVNCKFPGDEVPDFSLQKRASYGSILSIAACTESLFKSLCLFFTGMCYRRLFLAPHVPGNFWWKLIPRFISSASTFYQIIINNCVEGMTVGKMANVGDAVICNNHCKWLYWSNGITLTFGDNVLLCINGLIQSDDTNGRTPLSVTVDKIKTMKFFDGCRWEQQYFVDTDGFEVNVPEYIVQSSIEETGQTKYSCKLGCQILSLILEILNELCTDLFKGHPEKGIYSGSHFAQLVPCPYCYGDKSPLDGRVSPIDYEDSKIPTTESLHYLFTQSIKPVDFAQDVVVPENYCYGYNIQSCILEAQKCGILTCPVHGKLRLILLTPDLMFEDITALNKVSAKEVQDKKQQLGSGAFGAVYKVKLNSNPNQYVALKCFTNSIINGKLREHTLQDLAVMYADMRLEVNKLSSVDHPNIIKFLGLCVVSFSFLLEWAPKGNLDHMKREYKLAGFPICPDAIAITIVQVSSALAYLHTLKNIVHFDIKPDNVLIFKYPQPGHHCFSMEASPLECDSCYGEGGGVLVKLADLGVSAFVGPSGFHRSNTTPTYSAPEVLKYSGKEPLTEKVDIFALGISLYEVMTLRKLPPEGAYLDFNYDIAAGRRPEFLPEDPNYPLALVECVRTCWAHEYTQRPTAKTIEETFKKSNILRLHNSYELKNIVVTAAAVTVAKCDTVEEETIWIATAEEDGSYKLMTYIFIDQEYPVSHQATKLGKHVHPKLCVSSEPVQLHSRVKEMCHHGQHIWILYTSGYIAVFDMDSHKIIQNIELQELSNDPVTTLVVDHATGLIATAYTNGLIAYLWGGTIPFNDNVSIAYFRSANTIAVSYQNFRLTTVESCSDADGHCQVWCGYTIGVIQIVRPPARAYGETEILKVLQVDKYCTEVPHGTSIVQLKFSSNKSDKPLLMYALHGEGVAISCWFVSAEPKLCATINLSQATPASTLLLVNHTLYVGDKTGRIHVIDTHQITEGKYADKLLSGGHHAREVDYLIAVQGRLNAHGLLSAVGVSAIVGDDEQTRPRSTYHVKRLDSVPCTLLMSIGIGYHEVFGRNTSDNTYFVTWTFPCYL